MRSVNTLLTSGKIIFPVVIGTQTSCRPAAGKKGFLNERIPNVTVHVSYPEVATIYSLQLCPTNFDPLVNRSFVYLEGQDKLDTTFAGRTIPRNYYRRAQWAEIGDFVNFFST